jgi:hypothetical protein
MSERIFTRVLCYGIALVTGIACAIACSVTTDLDPLNSRVCDPGTKACNDKCIGLKDPVHGCGLPTCSPCSPPNAVARCNTNNQCDIASCEPGFNDCDFNPANGCEIQTDFDPLNCGRCGNKCATPPHGQPGCGTGSCVTRVCDPTFADCDKNFANGCETQLTTDPKRCGSCTNACKAGESCVPGGDAGAFCSDGG